ncbi:MAG: N-acetylornithine carbamoyltransferase [Gammaproteobacteria bacterium]
MRHYTHIADLGVDGVAAVVARVLEWKRTSPGKHLQDRLLGMVFFNPSLRTRVSFEAAMLRGGGHAVVLDVGAGVWKLEYRDGAVMDGDRPEHVREAVPVLGEYCDALAVRTFAALEDFDVDNADPVMRAFRAHATVPLISMESAREHPCQGLADVVSIAEFAGATRGVPVTLTWAPHVKPLPHAVPNSFLLTAAAAGCAVRVAHPPGFELHASVVAEAQALAQAAGGRVEFTHDQGAALDGSRAIYAKAWGPSSVGASVTAHRDWMLSRTVLDATAPDACFLHCLPLRRNVEVHDSVLDDSRSRVVANAANRFDVQRVLLDLMLNGDR